MKEITRQKLSDLYFKRLDATEKEILDEIDKRSEYKINQVKEGIG